MMAHRSDREPGHPAKCRRHHSLHCRMGPSSRIPSGPAVITPTALTGRTEDCTRPTPETQINPCNAGAIHRRHLADMAAERRAKAVPSPFLVAGNFPFVMAAFPQPPQVPGAPSDKMLHILAFTYGFAWLRRLPTASCSNLVLGLSAFEGLSR
jgi:hypothetical protein